MSEKIKTTTVKTKSGKDVKVPVVESKSYTKEGYVINAKEFNYIHVQLEKKEFDKNTGKKLSTPFIQKFTASEWKSFCKKGTHGFEVEILHTPDKANTKHL